jgi:multidrug efflux pump subunit AcrB
MNIAQLAIRNRTVTLVLTFVLLGGGLISYQGMSRLEDPEFTIKDALVITPYPGASAAEVEEEVSDALELAVQQMGQLDQVESKSDRGLSTLTVSIKKQYDKESLPQVWDELRRKVNDAQQDLPPGAGPSMVVDDYGDVYGVFVAIYGEEYSYAELEGYTDLLRREFLLVQDVAKIELPPDYTLEWGVEYEDSAEAQAGLAASLPVFLLIMVLVVIGLFNSLRQPLIIWLCVPLALIGVTAGLLITGQPFGFMALLGFLSLSGMLIKNAVVLIDEINLQSRGDKDLLTAIVDSGTSRLRPVAMAALTTALGMIPLLPDAFFVSMAVAIIAGLLFATVLTMVVVPVLYAIFFRVPGNPPPTSPV